MLQGVVLVVCVITNCLGLTCSFPLRSSAVSSRFGNCLMLQGVVLLGRLLGSSQIVCSCFGRFRSDPPLTGLHPVPFAHKHRCATALPVGMRPSTAFGSCFAERAMKCGRRMTTSRSGRRSMSAEGQRIVIFVVALQKTPSLANILQPISCNVLRVPTANFVFYLRHFLSGRRDVSAEGQRNAMLLLSSKTTVPLLVSAEGQRIAMLLLSSKTTVPLQISCSRFRSWLPPGCFSWCV